MMLSALQRVDRVVIGKKGRVTAAVAAENLDKITGG